MASCEDCGTTLRSGICTNCHEELCFKSRMRLENGFLVDRNDDYWLFESTEEADRYVWLPRQDDLQGMVKWELRLPTFILHVFNEGLKDDNRDKYKEDEISIYYKDRFAL